MMGDIKRKNANDIPSATKKTKKRQEEQVKSKLLSRPDEPTQEEEEGGMDIPQEETLQEDDTVENPDMVAEPDVEQNKKNCCYKNTIPITARGQTKRDEAKFVKKIYKYVKYLKEILANHRKVKKGDQISIDASCSMIITKNIPQKLKDSGSTVPIEIGDINFSKALCDLRANINLKPLSIYKKLGLGELKNTNITQQLTDISSVQPKWVLEDVLVTVCNFVIPIDFVILKFEEDCEIPILLVRPFLPTSRSCIDLE
ncbi:hypothetical protein EPI10_023314 [Gossypium australe]|uniref:Uncharacterized protein n=1 Tax=Gossypium australe TaxID=47621 RepID=A0A5B6VUM1_9ROSI|nr:hypothetical protein EPI10_023314 [Gossypium australe]